MKTREIPAAVKTVLPSTAIYTVIRAQNARLEEEKSRLVGELNSMKAPLAELVLSVCRFKPMLADQPENTQKAFVAIEAALQLCGLQTVDYTGREVTDDILERADIKGWEAGTAPVELVNECFTPEILWRGELIHTAQLFCSRAADKLEDSAEELHPEDTPAEQLAPETEKTVDLEPDKQTAAEPKEPAQEKTLWQRIKTWFSKKK